MWFEFSAPVIVGMSVLSYPLGDINLLLAGNLRHGYNKQRAAAHTYTYLPTYLAHVVLLTYHLGTSYLVFFYFFISTFFFPFLFVEYLLIQSTIF